MVHMPPAHATVTQNPVRQVTIALRATRTCPSVSSAQKSRARRLHAMRAGPSRAPTNQAPHSVRKDLAMYIGHQHGAQSPTFSSHAHCRLVLVHPPMPAVQRPATCSTHAQQPVSFVVAACGLTRRGEGRGRGRDAVPAQRAGFSQRG